MARSVSIGDYRLEVGDREVVVRDDQGSILDTIDLESMQGELTLPNGRHIDLAALLADRQGDVTDFETAAGPANDNAGAVVADFPAGFRAFNGDLGDRFDAGEGSGTLGDTSLSYRGIDGETRPQWDTNAFTQAANPITWSRHDQWSIAENQDGGTLGALIDGDPRDFDFAVSDPRFEIVDGVLRLKDGYSFDFETDPFVDLTVTATSHTGETQSQPVRIDVTDRNEAQTGLDLDNAGVAENAAGAIIGTLTVADPDSGDSQSFTVSDSRFEVVNGQLKLKDGIALDFETEPSVDVIVTATDKGGNSIAEQFTIGVGDVNEAPIALGLMTDGTQLIRNGSFEANALNAGQWKLFGAIDGWGTGTQIELQNGVTNKASDGKQVLELDSDYKVDSVYQDVQTLPGRVYALSFDTATRGDTKHTDAIEVYWNGVKIATVDPQSTAWQTSTFQVVGTGGLDRLEFREPAGDNDSYGGLLDNVSLKGMGSTVPENLPGVVIGDLTVTDPDAGDSHTFAVSDNRFEVVDGQLKLKDGVSLDYEAGHSVDVIVTATDSGGMAVQQSFAIAVANLNEAPGVSVTDGTVENHIVDTSTAYNPVANATVGAYLYSNDSAGLKVPSGNLLNGVDPSNMTLSAPTEVTVTFQKEAAGNHNMIGAYQYDDAGQIIAGSVRFVWLDATAGTEGKLGAYLSKDFLGYTQPGTVSLGTMAAGTHVGFFAISNGANNSGNQALLANAAAGTANQAAAMAAIASQLSIKTDGNGNARVYVGNSQMNGDTFFTHDKSLNTDFNAGKDMDHMASGISAKLDGRLMIGLEDLNGGGDRDYNDVVFSLDLGTYNVKKLTQSVVQPSVDFTDIDSDALSQAVIHSSGFQAGDSLNVPPSALFNVAIAQSGSDYTITIAGKTGAETVDQYEDFINAIYFSTSSKVEGDRHIDYRIVDEGGLTSNIATADIGISNSYEISASELAANQTSLGSGDDHLHLNSDLTGHLDFGDGYDTLHLARQGDSLGHGDFAKLENIEAIDMTGFGGNNVALSITDVLDMTDADHRLTVVGDKGDVVTLAGDGSGHHWSVVTSGDEFTTYAWSDPIQQAVVEISNQLTANLST